MNRTVDTDHNSNLQTCASAHSDEYFSELCALSTTDALTIEERRRLELHLSICAGCRQIKAQYDAVIATMLPATAADHVQAGNDGPSDSWSIGQAEESLMARIEREELSPENDPSNSMEEFKRRKSRWLYVGAAAFIAASLWSGYRIGLVDGRNSSLGTVLPLPIGTPHPDSNHFINANSSERQENGQQANRAPELEQQIQAKGREVGQLKEQLDKLQGELAERNSALSRDSQNRIELEQQLLVAQTNAQDLQDKLKVTVSKSSQDDTQAPKFQAQLDELTATMREKDLQIAQHEKLLEHDRDIRDLIGARDLYIAEIYDVAKNGKTQKPFGRVFYTKGKSLVFYAYDLDQQPGVKLASTFQAWGHKEIGQQRDINLGMFYQDDRNKKRWILKSNDPGTLAQIDAVFVTVEPSAESSKPTGKPLLFTYLRLTPNHP